MACVRDGTLADAPGGADGTFHDHFHHYHQADQLACDAAQNPDLLSVFHASWILDSVRDVPVASDVLPFRGYANVTAVQPRDGHHVPTVVLCISNQLVLYH